MHPILMVSVVLARKLGLLDATHVESIVTVAIESSRHPVIDLIKVCLWPSNQSE